MLYSLPVALSLEDTCTIPLASISKVTSIWGTPLGAGGDSLHIELAEHLVISNHFSLALEHSNRHGGLVVTGGGVHLTLLGGDGSVTVNHSGEHST